MWDKRNENKKHANVLCVSLYTLSGSREGEDINFMRRARKEKKKNEKKVSFNNEKQILCCVRKERTWNK